MPQRKHRQNDDSDGGDQEEREVRYSDSTLVADFKMTSVSSSYFDSSLRVNIQQLRFFYCYLNL